MDPTNIWSRRGKYDTGAPSVLSHPGIVVPAPIGSPLSFNLPSTGQSRTASPLANSGDHSSLSGLSQSSLSMNSMFGGFENKSDFADPFSGFNDILSPNDFNNASLLYQRTTDDHPLKYNWTLWFLHRAPGVKISDYEMATKEISSFSTIEDFWRLYTYLARPSKLSYTSEYHLFKTGVRPVWEDPTNIHGGKWILKFKKGTSSAPWESLLLAIIGGDFGDGLGDEIVGAVISIRREVDIISIWNKQGSNGSVNLKIRDIIRNVLGVANIPIEYKMHTDSMKEGVEKMRAAKAAIANGEKPYKGRGGHHTGGTRGHLDGHGSGRGRGSYMPRDINIRTRVNNFDSTGNEPVEEENNFFDKSKNFWDKPADSGGHF
ncbi:translation initiation factor eIF 4e-like domain-containing protein [Lipomyces arxii]|uniref:translation initiation factor eIF 4e-like domain-containing protein n=1 Tax=Lipomyces arxii TaxID=56418 RepID=UPI0034CF8543